MRTPHPSFCWGLDTGTFAERDCGLVGGIPYVNRITRKTHAFTLIELLVVISVIAVLMGILMPSLNKARRQAQSIQCQGNLKGYTLAVAMYAQDWNDQFSDPRSCYFKTLDRLPGDAQGRYILQRWCNGDINLRDYPQHASAFFKYLVDARGLICPTFKRIANHPGVEGWDNSIGEGVSNYQPWQNYSMNGFLGPKKPDPPSDAPPVVATVSKVKNPSDVFTFADESPFDDEEINETGLNDTALYAVYPPASGPKWIAEAGGNRWDVRPGPTGMGKPLVDIIAGFHNAPTGTLVAGKGNCAFADGHVGPVDRLDTFPHAWPK